MEIKFGKLNSQRVLMELKVLKAMNESITIKQASGSGSGDVVDSLMELSDIVNNIHGSITLLLDGTIEFLTNYSAQMQEADNAAAKSLVKE